jgi:hypothetical protein
MKPRGRLGQMRAQDRAFIEQARRGQEERDRIAEYMRPKQYGGFM